MTERVSSPPELLVSSYAIALSALGSERPPVLRQVIVWVIAAVVAAYLVSQVRKPNRWVGRPFLWLMNSSHSPVTNWGLSHITVGKQFTILDVGCGGGATVNKLVAIATDGMVYGVDYADGSVAVSRAKNARWIDAGRVDVRKASVSQLPFADATFDLVTAVETHYYWPDLANDVREILRVLKPGGTLVIIAESYRGGRFEKVQRVVMKPLKGAHLSVDEHRELLATAGFADVRVFVDRGKSWICVAGTTPA